MHDMPSSNKVWGAYLYKLGYRRYIVQDTYPDIYTIKKFCEDNSHGAFLVCTDNIERSCFSRRFIKMKRGANHSSLFYGFVVERSPRNPVTVETPDRYRAKSLSH